MSNEQIVKNMQAFVGKKVMVLSGECQGQRGKTIRPEVVDGMPRMLVRLESKEQIWLTNKDLMFITHQIRIDPSRQN